MITNPRDYYSLLHRIQSNNPPSLAILLPTDEKVYKVDLDAKTIETPEYLSVEKDHRAETIYFKVNRFFGFYDLTQSVCVIQYVNALGESRVYAVPYYDADTLSETDEILFPWVIDGDATKAAGTITYSIRFYKLTDSGKYLLYNLNTLPTQSKILNGIIGTEDEYIKVTDITEENFNDGTYYIQNEEGNFVKAEVFDIKQTYYVYRFEEEQEILGTLKEEVLYLLKEVEDGFNIYWEES